MRRLKLLLAALLFLSSTAASALGLGELQLNSALNEPLDAELKLHSVSPADIDNIKVNLASLQDFLRAGIDRPHLLSRLRFKVEDQGDGRAVVRVTSRQPIREPFLNFLIELNWPNGRMLREYTMLLDPPVLAKPKATVVVSAPAAAAPVAAAPAPAERELFPRTSISEPSTVVAAPAAAPAGDTYGPTQRDDTLWNIAGKVRPGDDTSIEQMMMALLDANPNAFIDNNINNLKAGMVLRIPARDQILARTKAAAARAARAQYEEWRSARASLAQAPSAPPVGAQASTPPVVEPQAVAAAPVEAEVKLVSPRSEAVASAAAPGAGTGSGDAIAEVRRDLALTNEALSAAEQENADLNTRVKALEEQIASMQRLLALKNDALAEMQAKLGSTAQAPAQPVEPPAPPAPPAVAQPATPATPAMPLPLALAGPGQLNQWAMPAFPRVDPATVQPRLPASPAEEPIWSALPTLLDDPALLAVALVVVLVLAAMVWLAMRKRAMSTAGAPESILTKAAPAAAAGAGAASATAAGIAAEPAETSLVSDFAPSTMHTPIESDVSEVDALAEADVYLAYHKFQQAEELLKDAIGTEPERLDLQVKLLEVYYANRDETAFGDLAEQVQPLIGEGQEAVWTKIEEMGRDLCPRHRLFGGAPEFIDDLSGEVAAQPEQEEPALGAFDEFENLDEAPITPPTIEPETEEALSAGEQGLDFEFEDFATAKEEQSESASTLDFDTDFERETHEAVAASESTAFEVDEDELRSFTPDFDLDVGAEAATATETEAEAKLDLGEALDFELPESVETEDQEPDQLLSLDEVATKLDLARAYIDMGDPDGARSILDEVVAEGNDEQKQEAQTLMSSIGP